MDHVPRALRCRGGRLRLFCLGEQWAPLRRRRLPPGQADLERRTRRIHAAFHGGRTVRLLHALRDAGLPDLPLREALAEAPFVAQRPGESLEAVRNRLEQAWR